MAYSLKIMLLAFLSAGFFVSKGQVLTIQDAVDQSILNNAQINQMRSKLKQKNEAWRMQSGISSPEVSYMKEGMNGKTADPFQEQRLTISQTVDFPLTTSYRMKALREEVKAMEFAIKAEEREIKVGVKTRYIEVLYALHLQKLRDQQLKLATELYNAVYTQFETGMGNGMDLTKAELQVAEANNDIDDARRLLHLARYGLFNLMGLPPENQKYSIQFMDSLMSTDVDISQIQALAVLTDQPLYKSSTSELAASNYFLKEAKSNILPDIRFNLYKQDYGTGYNFNGFEVGLSFPIWYPLEQKGRINTTLARQDEIRWKQQEIKLDMKKQIEFAWHSYEVSRSTIKRYDETIRSKAEKLQTLTLTAYRLGEVDLLNLISAQQIYLNSQQRYLSSLRDFYIQLVELEKFLDKDLVY
ncbi:MAG TPA: TolC family protein [Prolixibacteraceae bacterium]|nr:TolC family protein [Prolixibacteraceae bacterium]